MAPQAEATINFAGTKITPEQAAIFGLGGNSDWNSHPTPAGGGGGGFFHSLGNLGMDALKALSVPEAALYTTAAKIAGRPVSWKDALGDFHTNASGQTGTQAALSALGIHNKWAQLGTQVVADPLWALAPVKLAAEGADAAKAGELAADAAKAGETGADAAAAGGSAFNRAAAVKAAESAPPAPAWKNLLREAPPETPPVQDLPAQIRVTPTGADRSGARVGEYFVQKLNSTNKAMYRKYGIFKVGEDGGLVPESMLPNTFTHQADAIEFARNISKPADQVAAEAAQPFAAAAAASRARSVPLNALRTIGERIGAEAPPPFVEEANRASDLAAQIRDRVLAGEAPNPGDLHDALGVDALGAGAGSMEATRLANIDRLAQNGQLGVKIGFGKHAEEGGKGLSGLNYTFNTGINLPGKSLATWNAGRTLKNMFIKDPISKVFRRTENIAQELAGDSVRQLGGARAAELANGMTPEQLRAVTFVGQAENASLKGFKGAELTQSAPELKRLLHSWGMWNDRSEELLRYFQQRGVDMADLEARTLDPYRGTYFPQSPELETLRALAKARKEDPTAWGPAVGTGVRSTINPDRARKYQSAFAMTDKASYGQHLQNALGLTDQQTAQVMSLLDAATSHADELMKNKGSIIQALKEAGVEETPAIFQKDARFGFNEAPHPEGWLPEMDPFALASERTRSHYRQLLTNSLIRSIHSAGLDPEAAVGKDMFEKLSKRANLAGISGTTQSTRLGQILKRFVPQYKAMLTTLNLGPHYMSNMQGDWWNSLVNGNLRHLAASPFGLLGYASKGTTRGNKFFKLAGALNKDVTPQAEKALTDTYHVLGKDYTGAELLTMSHMFGLGRGYVGADIHDFIDLANASHNPFKQFRNFAERQNFTRENAQRIQTWFKHMEAGDNPMVAAQKTLRVHFDYGDLTDFELNTMRNMILFYTWMRKNLPLQVSGLATRPGLYAAQEAANADRTRFPNEPAYYALQGAWPTPFGNYTFSSPVTDLYKLDAGDPVTSFRQNVLGSLLPQYKIPIEIATKQDMFTGAPLEKYPGQKVPSWLGMLPGLGTPTVAHKGGQPTKGVPWWVAMLGKELGGPYSQDLSQATAPDSAQSGPAFFVRNVLGFPKFQVNDQAKFARSAQIVAAKKKADATRLRNATQAGGG